MDSQPDVVEYHQSLVRIIISHKAAHTPSTVCQLGILQENASISPLAQGFPHFSELPTEIRLQIWRHCLPGRRAVGIAYGERSQSVYSQYPAPIALHICRESRIEALKRYELVFVCRPDAGGIYFDFSQDCLHFRKPYTHSGHLSKTLHKLGDDLARVRFMSCFLRGASSFHMPNLPDFKLCKALEEAILLLSPGGPEGPDLIFVDPSEVTLSPSSSFSAIEFSEQDRNQVVVLKKCDPDFPQPSGPKITIMSYRSGHYRVC